MGYVPDRRAAGDGTSKSALKTGVSWRHAPRQIWNLASDHGVIRGHHDREWYDFYIFGSLAVYLSPKFYPPGNDTLALIA